MRKKWVARWVSDGVPLETSAPMFRSQSLIRVTRATYGYGSDGLVTSVNEGSGITLAVAAQAGQGLHTSSASTNDYGVLTDGAGDATTYGYNDAGQETLQLSPDAGDPEWQVNADGLVTLYVDEYGLSTEYQYSSAGDMTQEVDPDGSTTLYQYNSLHEVTQEIDEPAGGRDATTANFYDSAGDLLTQITDPSAGSAAATTVNHYTSTGLLTSSTDPDGNLTTYFYDSSRQLTFMAMYDSGSHEVDYSSETYDSYGNVADTITADGTTVDSYNSLNELTSEVVYDANGITEASSTGYAYSPSGLLTQTIDGDGNTITNVYNSAGLVTQEETLDSGGHVISGTSFTYNAASEVSTQIDGDGNATTYGYDGDGNVTAQVVTDSGSTTVGKSYSYYNNEDELTEAIDGDGNTTFYGYSLGSMTSESVYASGGTSPISYQSWGYDSHQDQTYYLDADGNTTLSGYDSGEHITSQTVYDSHPTLISSQSWQYDSSGDMTETIDPDHNTTLYGYDGAGNVTSESVYDSTPTFKGSESFSYDPDGNQTKLIDFDGNTTDSYYDGGVMTEQAIYQDGSMTPMSVESWGYDQAQQQTLYIDPDHITTLSQYDGEGNMTGETIYTSGHTISQSWAYDDAGNQTLYIDPDDISTISSYEGNLMTQKVYQYAFLTSSESWSYDRDENQTASIDGDGNTTVTDYDGGQIVKELIYNSGHALVSGETFAYDLAGNQTSLIDGDGNTTLSQYDALGDVTLNTYYNSVGSSFASESWAYDAADNLTLHIGTDHYTTESYYDDGEMTSQQISYLSFTNETWGYDADGNQTLHIDINGFKTLSTYDDNLLVTQVVDNSLGGQVDSETWAYDYAGNVTSYRDNDGKTTESAYDGEGWMTQQKVIYNASTTTTATWEYDDDGNVTEQIDPLGRTTLSDYDNNGDVTEQIDAAGTSLAATTLTYYDQDGNLSEVDTPAIGISGSPGYAPANSTSFQYLDGRQTMSYNAMGDSTTMFYDLDGNMTEEIDADGRLQLFGYDALGLETSNVWYSGSTTSTTVMDSISFGYDPNGNMTYAADDASTYTMEYNPLNEITQAVEKIGTSTTVTLTMGYNGDGDRTLLEDSLGGTIDYSYDTADELTSEVYTQSTSPSTSVVMSFDQVYDWQGRVTEQLDYSGATLVGTSSTDYNADGLVTGISQYSNAASSVIASYSMLYDADDELTKQIDHGATTTYGYDNLGELTNDNGTTQTFDADGNNTSDTVTLGNEVTYDGTYHYQYDKEGNETLMYDTTTSTTWSYSYDDENQMTEAQETIGYTLVMEANYEYDAFGSQVEENVGTTATEYVQDHWNPATAGATGLSGTNVVADVTAAGSLITGYVWGNEVDQLFGRYDTSLSSVPTAGAYYLFVDQNGSVRDVVNSSGVDKDSIKYDGFGAFVTQTNANYLGLYGYDSYHYDAATGNYDDNARDYDPVSQRWVTMDPDGIGGGTPNLYEYAGNDPTNATDPSGLDSVSSDGGKVTWTPIPGPSNDQPFQVGTVSDGKVTLSARFGGKSVSMAVLEKVAAYFTEPHEYNPADEIAKVFSPEYKSLLDSILQAPMEAGLPGWLIKDYGWSYGKGQKIHTPRGTNLQPLFKDVSKLSCEKLQELMNVLAKSNAARGEAVLRDEAHAIQFFQEYLLYLAAAAWFQKNCGDKKTPISYDAPPPAGYVIPQYIIDSLNDAGVTLRKAPTAFEKPIPNSWRMDHVSPYLKDPYPCIRCHPWDGRMQSPTAGIGYTQEEKTRLLIGFGIVGAVVVVPVAAVVAAPAAPAVAGTVVIGSVSSAAAALLISSGLRTENSPGS